jgi:hypothetical protein
MPERRRLLIQARAKRDEAQTIRDISRFLSVHADKAMFDRDAEQLERDAARLEDKAAALMPGKPGCDHIGCSAPKY